ncbi:MAG: heme NO-binding domain-containing protein [Flavobacteriia bacterium]|jgi:hypothetical protein
MYGIVNQSIQGLVTDNHGRDKWEKIKVRSGLLQDYFISNEPYEDNITYELIGAASEVLELSEDEVLRSFGEYWILKTGYERYGDLMKAGGKNLYEFLCNLPNFHGRIMLIYPDLRPPEFVVERISEKEVTLHYYSARKGLTHFVIGLIQGLAKMFQETVEISVKDQEYTDVWHDVFQLKIT